MKFFKGQMMNFKDLMGSFGDIPIIANDESDNLYEVVKIQIVKDKGIPALLNLSLNKIYPTNMIYSANDKTQIQIMKFRFSMLKGKIKKLSKEQYASKKALRTSHLKLDNFKDLMGASALRRAQIRDLLRLRGYFKKVLIKNYESNFNAKS